MFNAIKNEYCTYVWNLGKKFSKEKSTKKIKRKAYGKKNVREKYFLVDTCYYYIKSYYIE